MSHENFRQLVDQVCEETGIEVSKSMYESVEFDYMGIAFTLVYRPTLECVAIVCDFGVPPEEERELVLQKLLETNAFAIDITTPCFALSPDTGHVFMKGYIPADGLSKTDLLTQLGMYVMVAYQWRETHFTDEAANGFSSSYTPQSSTQISV